MVGEVVQRRIVDSIVTIVGAGKSGFESATRFAGLGVERFRIIDQDILEEHNLIGMAPTPRDEVGKPKAAVLANQLVKC